MSAPSTTPSATVAAAPANVPASLLSILSSALEAVIAANQQTPVVNQAATEVTQAQQRHVQAYGEWNRRQQAVQSHQGNLQAELTKRLATPAPAQPATVVAAPVTAPIAAAPVAAPASS